MILTCLHAEPGSFGDSLGYLPARAASIALPARRPHRGHRRLHALTRCRAKNRAQEKWLAACQDAFAARRPAQPLVAAIAGYHMRLRK